MQSVNRANVVSEFPGEIHLRTAFPLFGGNRRLVRGAQLREEKADRAGMVQLRGGVATFEEVPVAPFARM